MYGRCRGGSNRHQKCRRDRLLKQRLQPGFLLFSSENRTLEDRRLEGLARNRGAEVFTNSRHNRGGPGGVRRDGKCPRRLGRNGEDGEHSDHEAEEREGGRGVRGPCW